MLCGVKSWNSEPSKISHYGTFKGSVADPNPGSGIRCLFDPWIRDPGSGMGRKSASGSEIRDEQPGSYFLEGKILKFFDADPGSGMETGRIRFPVSGMEKSRIRDPGYGMREKHPGSATLFKGHLFLVRFSACLRVPLTTGGGGGSSRVPQPASLLSSWIYAVYIFLYMYISTSVCKCKYGPFTKAIIKPNQPLPYLPKQTTYRYFSMNMF